MKIMKAIYGIIIAATAASLALVSCSKEFDSPDRAETGGIGAERVITLTFDEATKSQISGYHPSFKAGDKILLSNGGSKEECTVSVDSYGATVTTTLTGTLKAVYPSSAAVLSENAITGVQVSSTQHGTFAEANIAMAEDIIPGGMARFKLKTAVLRFYVDETIDVKEITVTSAGADITSDGGGKTISVTPVSPATYLYEMTVDHPDRRICYVAVLPGVTASDLTFTSDTESQGIVTRQSSGTGTLAVKGMYDAFIPYYIKIHIGPGANDYQRWGYCNIGAFLPEEAGKYFAWGDIVGQTWNGSSWSGEGFSYNTYRFGTSAGSEKFSKYVLSSYSSLWGGSGDPDNKSLLEFADDAAYVGWGAPWQMPTGGKDANADFLVLFKTFIPDYPGTGFSEVPRIETEPESQGVYLYDAADKRGIYLVDELKNKLFFPYAGIGVDTSPITYPNESAFYWSRTLYPYNDKLYGFTLISNDCKLYPVNGSNRYHGLSIRPIYKNSAGPLDIGEYDEPENIE